jgi:uncharacterized protein YdbL (DUF1318 family)
MRALRESPSFSFVPAAYAQEATSVSTPAIRALKDSMKSRFPSLKPYFDAGNIGETNLGMLEVRDEAGLNLQAKAALRNLVKDENSDRARLYAEVAQALKIEAAKAGPEDHLRYLLALQQAEAGLKYSTMPRIYFEAFLVKLCHFRKIVPLRELIKDIESFKETPQRTTARPSGPPAREAAPAAVGSRPALGGGPQPGPRKTPSEPAAPPKPETLSGKDIFGRVLEKLAVDRAPLAALLGEYSSVMVRDNALEVFFGSGRGFFVTSIQEKDVRAVEKAASDVLGRDIRVRFAEESATGGGPIKPGRELESAMKDPAVQFFMNTFKAQVLSADPVPSPRDAAPKGRGPTENES